MLKRNTYRKSNKYQELFLEFCLRVPFKVQFILPNLRNILAFLQIKTLSIF